MKIENEKSRVYRYKTLDEIAEALQNNLSFEYYKGNYNVPTYYYIHIDEEDVYKRQKEGSPMGR